MTENASLLDIEKSIKNYNPNVITKIIGFEKLNKSVLFVYSRGASNKVQLFDDVNGLNEIGMIGYSRTDNTFISALEVKKHYQGNGVGRFLFEFALAHVDILGVTSAHGEIMPTNDIKGVKLKGIGSHTAHKLKLVEIYKKLGCTIDDIAIADDGYPSFTITWKKGERFNNSNIKIQDLVAEVVEKQKIIDSKIK